jgi:hypothetical protein
MNKSKPAQKRAATKRKSAPAKGASKGRSAVAGKAKGAAASAKAKTAVSAQRAAGATAPVVYQTLREKVDAVDSNVGTTLTLSDFLKSSGWS